MKTCTITCAKLESGEVAHGILVEAGISESPLVIDGFRFSDDDLKILKSRLEEI